MPFYIFDEDDDFLSEQLVEEYRRVWDAWADSLHRQPSRHDPRVPIKRRSRTTFYVSAPLACEPAKVDDIKAIWKDAGKPMTDIVLDGKKYELKTYGDCQVLECQGVIVCRLR